MNITERRKKLLRLNAKSAQLNSEISGTNYVGKGNIWIITNGRTREDEKQTISVNLNHSESERKELEIEDDVTSIELTDDDAVDLMNLLVKLYKEA